jgi:hypothetical protein
MVTLKKAVIVTVGAMAVALGVAAPAGADPGDNPCQLAVSFLCRFVPLAPDLDHDIDLTQSPGTINGQQLPEMPASGQSPEDLPPADPCANGCS